VGHIRSAAEKKLMSNREGGTMQAKPHVILVHGAFADASSWSTVIQHLQAVRYTVIAVQIELASLAEDIDRTRTVLTAQGGPTVLVGQGYGGAVITAAATGSPQALSLVYVAAFAPDQGESSLESVAGFPAPPCSAHYIPDYRPGFARLDPAAFPQCFMQDVPLARARALAVTQKPAAQVIFATKLGPVAWRTLPSWYLVSEDDRMINPDAERHTAKRMGATTIVVRGSSHASPVSHPDEVADAIKAASRAGAKP
jgi:pimeloyl-ACP methyl ester carboxylesterase